MADVPIRVTNLNKLAQQSLRQDDRKLHYSYWFITINTNWKPDPDEPDAAEEVAENLQKAVEKLLTHEGLKQVIVFMDEFDKDSFSRDVIEKVSGKFGVEIGEKKRGGRVHVHGDLKVKHYSKIQLDYRAIKTLIMRELIALDETRVAGLHVDGKLVRGGGTTIERYMTKGLFAFPREEA